MNATYLKTQTVKREYLVTLTISDPLACLSVKHAYPICAESVSAALRELAEEFEGKHTGGTFDVAVSLLDAPERELYANTLAAPAAHIFLRSCATDAAK